VGSILAAACGGRVDVVAPEDAAAVTDARSVDVDVRPETAILVGECGPTDGDAFAIVIAPSARCDSLPAPADVGTTLRFYGPTLPESVGSFPIGDGSVAAGSGATVCDSSGCVAAASGTLTITEEKWFEGFITEVYGTYALTLVDGTTRAGAFVTTNCHNGPDCG